MSEYSIDRALEAAAVEALGWEFVDRIAFEGVHDPRLPPSSGAWAQLIHLPASAEVASLGVGGQDEHTGVFQVDVSVPEVGGNPREALLDCADRLRRYFVAGRRLTHCQQGVRVRSASRSAIRRVDGWLRISVSVTYSAFTTRPEV